MAIMVREPLNNNLKISSGIYLRIILPRLVPKNTAIVKGNIIFISLM